MGYGDLSQYSLQGRDLYTYTIWYCTLFPSGIYLGANVLRSFYARGQVGYPLAHVPSTSLVYSHVSQVYLYSIHDFLRLGDDLWYGSFYFS